MKSPPFGDRHFHGDFQACLAQGSVLNKQLKSAASIPISDRVIYHVKMLQLDGLIKFLLFTV